MNLDYRLILASKSPRRQSLLRSLDLPFEVDARPIEESFPKEISPFDVAEFLACKKADAFNDLLPNELIITSDTVVILHDKILGKAKDKQAAVKMLQNLSGQTHHVTTGVCLKSKDKTLSFKELTTVTFDELSSETIDYYIDKYQPFDKAGAYGIQEWIGMIGISKIEGDYYNVMGLPLNQLYKQLSDF